MTSRKIVVLAAIAVVSVAACALVVSLSSREQELSPKQNQNAAREVQDSDAQNSSIAVSQARSTLPRSPMPLVSAGEVVESPPAALPVDQGDTEPRNDASTERSSEELLATQMIKGEIRGVDGNPLSGLLVACDGKMTRSRSDGGFDLAVPRTPDGKYADVNVSAPSRVFFRRIALGDSVRSVSETIDVGRVMLPSGDPEIRMSGRVAGDRSLFPPYVRLQSTDGTIVGILPIRADGTFSGSGYPPGDYYLMNVSKPGVALPPSAALRKVAVSLRDKALQEVVFDMEPAH